MGLFLLFFLFLDTLSKEDSIVGGFFSRLDGLSDLFGLQVTLTLESDGSNETLNLGGLGVFLFALDDFTANNVFADIIILFQREHLSNLGGTLGAETLGDLDIGQSGNILFTLAD